MIRSLSLPLRANVFKRGQNEETNLPIASRKIGGCLLHMNIGEFQLQTYNIGDVCLTAWRQNTFNPHKYWFADWHLVHMINWLSKCYRQIQIPDRFYVNWACTLQAQMEVRHFKERTNFSPHIYNFNVQTNRNEQLQLLFANSTQILTHESCALAILCTILCTIVCHCLMWCI